MVIVLHASPTNRGLLNCSASFRRTKIKNYEGKDKKTRALALAKARCAPVTGGDSALVRRFQSANWSSSRLSGSVVCYVADKLEKKDLSERYEKDNRSRLSAPRNQRWLLLAKFDWRFGTERETAHLDRR
jgi:hypothetical protein